MSEPATAPQPHRDPTEWGRLVESLDVASVYVVIQSWPGARLRATVAVEDIWQETLWLSCATAPSTRRVQESFFEGRR
jgi:hypothetical protein